MMAKTLTNYYDEAGKRGAIDSLVRYKNETEFYTWDYGYDSDRPNLVTISVKEPFGPTISYKFSYGVKNEVSDGSSQLIRNISGFNSAIKSEANPHGGTVGYTYDDAGRQWLMEALLGVEPSGRCQWELWGYITSILLTAGCWLNMMDMGHASESIST